MSYSIIIISDDNVHTAILSNATKELCEREMKYMDNDNVYIKKIEDD